MGCEAVDGGGVVGWRQWRRWCDACLWRGDLFDGREVSRRVEEARQPERERGFHCVRPEGIEETDELQVRAARGAQAAAAAAAQGIGGSCGISHQDLMTV